MILCDCFDRTSQDSTYLHVFYGCGFRKFLFELICDASNAVYGQFFMPVNGNVALEEKSESLDQHVVNARVIAMFDDEWNQRCQESIGGRLAVNTLDNVGHSQIEFAAKLLFECFGKRSLEKSVQQRLAKKGTATFVAKNVAEWRRVLHNVFPIIETTVRARPQNASNARFVSANCSGSTQ